ncbi:MAG: GGDEF domain-containing protein [Sneathiella sp.]|nr:GGDEF domain-containing protein [Sneathiella sp.]
MSGSQFVEAIQNTGMLPSQEGDVTVYLENLATRLKDSNRNEPENEDRHWNLINRVLAYAASAEQHIAEQKLRIRELEDLSTTDELTGLNNRRGLRDFLNRAISSARRHTEAGIVAFLDLDDFKRINDFHGHDAGDQVLRQLAAILMSNLRDTDFVARLGGDEFVFILDRADYAKGMARAEEIRDMLCESVIPLKRGDVPLSVSMGISKYDCDSCYDTILREADQAMYEDKRKRRALAR